MKKLILLILASLPALIGHAQSWKADADALVVNQIFEKSLGHINIYAFPEMLTSADAIFTTDGDTLPVPYANCYAYFIDPMPFTNWAHPCKYCFVNASLNYSITNAEMPPACDTLTPLSLFPRPTLPPFTSAIDTTITLTTRQTDPEHLWAVLICGESGICNNREHDHYTNYWFDLSCVYTVLTNRYGYKEALMNTSNGIIDRRIFVTAPEEIMCQYKGSYSCSDLNGNFTGDNFGSGDFLDCNGTPITKHTKENIHNIFRCMAGENIQGYNEIGLRKLTEEDQLFIFITGHGHKNNGTTYFHVNNSSESITDAELTSWLRGIKCSQMTLLSEPCHGGGFVDLFMNDINNANCQCKNRIGQSATSADGVSHGEAYMVYAYNNSGIIPNSVSEFVYYWASAALGYYPCFQIVNDSVAMGPWSVQDGRGIGNGAMNWRVYFGEYEDEYSHADYDVDPDTDGDGIVSLHEQFVFANNLDTWSWYGYYNPHYPDTLDENYHPEFPKERYESTFTKEAATLIGYEGQVDGLASSGSAIQPYRLCGNLWIGPNSELTMRDNVLSPEGIGIFVKPTGKLLVDGATLTNLPETGSSMWQGIQVWGDASKHQSKENGKFWQGFLQLENGARIENAIVGIEVGKPGDLSASGGIVSATDAQFVNNTMAARFHPYENQHQNPSQYNEVCIRNNVSRFHNCVFSINENYIDPQSFNLHVNLSGVRGVSFLGCDFSVERNRIADNSPIGIYAHNAGARIGLYSIILPHNQIVRKKSTFEGFYKAVVSTNDAAMGLRPLTIQNTNFTNNDFGVHILNTNFATIVNSTFDIGHDTTLCAAGIYAENTPNFIIEQDTFGLAKYHPHDNFGIIIVNSMSQNQVYKNVFDSLYCGNYALGVNSHNMSDHLSPTQHLGLEYRCNENRNNTCDFYVSKIIPKYQQGIQQNQGMLGEAANNTFSTGGYHFINYGDYRLNYYYDPSLSNGLPTVKYRVDNFSTTDTVGCPIHNYIHVPINDTLNPVNSDTLCLQRELDFYDAYNTFSTIKSIYDRKIDGGDTQGTVDDILTAPSSDMWRLRAQLLNASPYLSEEVLTNMASRTDMFPHSVIFEILSSNPEELKKSTLMDHLHDMEHPLPDYMIGLLQQMAEGVTFRTALETQMAKYRHIYKLAASDIIRYTLNDTVIDRTRLIGWLGNMFDLESDRDIVSIYMGEGDFESALELANLLPLLYDLQGEDLEEHDDYMLMVGLYHTLHQSGRTTYQLTEQESDMVASLAENSSGTPQAMAKSIMASVYGERYGNCPEKLDFGTNIRGNAIGTGEALDMGKAMGLDASVSPSPATTWTAVDYQLPVGFEKAKFQIVNTLGQPVIAHELSGNTGQKILDLRGLNPGVYTYSLQCGKHISSGKLVIVK